MSCCLSERDRLEKRGRARGEVMGWRLVDVWTVVMHRRQRLSLKAVIGTKGAVLAKRGLLGS